MNKRLFLTMDFGNSKSLTVSDISKKMLLESAPIILESEIKYQKKNCNLLEKDANKMRKNLKLELNKLKKSK